MTPVAHPERTWLDDHGREWVTAGLITEDQLDAIRRHEHVDEPQPPRRFTIGAEVATYLGSVLALMGAAVVVGQTWDELAFPARLALASTLAIVGLVAGGWFRRQGEPGTDRLAGFVSVLGIGGLVFAAGLVVDRLDPPEPEWTALAVGVTGVVAGGLLWRNRERPLELAATAAGLATSVVAVGALLGTPVWLAGALLILLGTALAVVTAVGEIHPRLVGTAVGALGAFVGGFMLGEANQHVGPAAALVVAIALIGYATRSDETALLVLGVVGALFATQVLLATSFSGAISSLVVSIVGLAIVVAVITRTRRRPT